MHMVSGNGKLFYASLNICFAYKYTAGDEKSQAYVHMKEHIETHKRIGTEHNHCDYSSPILLLLL